MKELETIEGIGPKTKELLNKIKIYTVEDLLNYYPYRYDIIKRSEYHFLQSLMTPLSYCLFKYWSKKNGFQIKR